jgi:hypothetical protein
LVDQIAATLILEGWLAERGTDRDPSVSEVNELAMPAQIEQKAK